MRRVAPELLGTARTEGWGPEDLLRALVEAEVAGRDASNTQIRLKEARLPVMRSLEDFDVTASSIPRPTFDYLTSLGWLDSTENLYVEGPAGTGKTHLLDGLGQLAVEAGNPVRYFSTTGLVERLGFGLTDNSLEKAIGEVLHARLVIIDDFGFAPLGSTGSRLLLSLVAAAYEHTSIALATHVPVHEWGRFLHDQSTANSIVDRFLHHSIIVVTEGESFRMREARERPAGPRCVLSTSD
jgi:DNA replication protein DnaC